MNENGMVALREPPAASARLEALATKTRIHTRHIDLLEDIPGDVDLVTESEILALLKLANIYRYDWTLGLPDADDLLTRDPSARVLIKDYLIARGGPHDEPVWETVSVVVRGSQNLVGEGDGRPVYVPQMSVNDASRISADLMAKALKELEHVIGLSR